MTLTKDIRKKVHFIDEAVLQLLLLDTTMVGGPFRTIRTRCKTIKYGSITLVNYTFSCLWF